MRKVFLCLIIIFSTVLFPLAVNADEIGTATITGSLVNVRSGPGLEYNKTDKLPQNTRIPVLVEKDGWYKVKLPSGETGWVIDDYSEMETKKSLTITVNENIVDFDTLPYIDQNDRTMVPIRFVAEELGAAVGWDGEEKKVSISIDNKSIFLWIDNAKAQVNEKEIELDTEPVIKDVRTMVPLRFVSEILGAQISWDSDTQTIAILLKEKETEEKVASSTTKKVATITGNVVNIRSGPGLKYEEIDQYPKNTVFDILSESTDNDNKTWYKIQLPYKKEGWIAGWLVNVSFDEDKDSSEYVKDLRKDALIIGNVVNVRSGSSLQHDVIDQVEKGDVLVIAGQANDWYEVLLSDSSSGWIHNSLVSMQSVDSSRGNVSREDYKDNFTLIENNVQYPALINVDLVSDNIENQLLVQGNVKLNYSTIILQDPLRLVIDIKDTTVAMSSENLARDVNNDLIKSLRVGQFTKDVSRIVLDLSQFASYSVQSFEDGKVLSFCIQKSSLQDKIIVLDPGHGSIQPGNWSDPGAVGPSDVYERDVVLDISEKVANILNSQGATVIMTRTGDTVLSLAGRAAVANDVNADIFVSIHANASPNKEAKGSSVYYYAPTWRSDSAKREKLARLIQYYMVNNAGTKDLGVFEKGFTVLTETQVPSVLVETAFISNRYEEKMLIMDDFQNKLARGIVQGINSYFIENK